MLVPPRLTEAQGSPSPDVLALAGLYLAGAIQFAVLRQLGNPFVQQALERASTQFAAIGCSLSFGLLTHVSDDAALHLSGQCLVLRSLASARSNGRSTPRLILRARRSMKSASA